MVVVVVVEEEEEEEEKEEKENDMHNLQHWCMGKKHSQIIKK